MVVGLEAGRFDVRTCAARRGCTSLSDAVLAGTTVSAPSSDEERETEGMYEPGMSVRKGKASREM